MYYRLFFVALQARQALEKVYGRAGKLYVDLFKAGVRAAGGPEKARKYGHFDRFSGSAAGPARGIVSFFRRIDDFWGEKFGGNTAKDYLAYDYRRAPPFFPAAPCKAARKMVSYR